MIDSWTLRMDLYGKTLCKQPESTEWRDRTCFVVLQFKSLCEASRKTLRRETKKSFNQFLRFSFGGTRNLNFFFDLERDWRRRCAHQNIRRAFYLNHPRAANSSLANYNLLEFALLRVHFFSKLNFSARGKIPQIYRDEHEKSLLKHIFGGFITCCYHFSCHLPSERC